MMSYRNMAIVLPWLALLSGCVDESAKEPGKEPALELRYVDAFQEVWSQPAGIPVRFWRPVAGEGYASLGDYAQGDVGETRGYVLVARELQPGTLAAPVGYERRWTDGVRSLWDPLAPEGYTCLGLVAQPSPAEPGADAVRCVRDDLLTTASAGNAVWHTPAVNEQPGLNAHQVVPAGEHGVFLGTIAGLTPGAEPSAHASSTIDERVVRRPEVGAQAANALIAAHGPLLVLHPGEEYLPDDPTWILDNRAALEWGIVHGDTYGDWSSEPVGSRKTSTATLVQDVASALADRRAGEAGFKYWLRVDLGQQGEVQPPPNGSLERAKAMVRVKAWNWLFTDLQFWIYYPFNGSGKFHVFCGTTINLLDDEIDMNHQAAYPAGPGRHYGDWENVTVRVENLTGEIAGVFLSRHGKGEWFLRRQLGTQLAVTDGHPVVYSARDSHAHYASAQKQCYEIKVTPIAVCNVRVDLLDYVDGSSASKQLRTWEPAHHLVVSTALSGAVATQPPAWFQYAGAWGQTEKLRYVFEKTVAIFYPARYEYTDLAGGPRGPIAQPWWENGPSGLNWWWPAEPRAQELCHNGEDDDGNGQTDCADEGCVADALCRWP